MTTLSFNRQGVPVVDGRVLTSTRTANGYPIYDTPDFAIIIGEGRPGEMSVTFSDARHPGNRLEISAEGYRNLEQYAQSHNQQVVFTRGRALPGQFELVLADEISAGMRADDISITNDYGIRIRPNAAITFFPSERLGFGIETPGAITALHEVFARARNSGGAITPAQLEADVEGRMRFSGMRADLGIDTNVSTAALDAGRTIVAANGEATGNGAIQRSGGARTVT